MMYSAMIPAQHNVLLLYLLSESHSVKTGERADIVSDFSHHDSINQVSTQSQGTSSPPKPPQSVSDRKFNVVIYGIKKSPSSTPKAIRINCDLENLQHTLSDKIAKPDSVILCPGRNQMNYKKMDYVLNKQ